MGTKSKQRLGRPRGSLSKLPRKSPPENHSTEEAPAHLITPKRNSLIAQACEAIRQRIAERVWVDKLPGERALCQILQISRPTLRSALAILQREKVIGVSPSRHRSIRKQKASASGGPSHLREIILLSPEQPPQMQPSTLFLIDEAHNYLQKAGFKLRIESPAWLAFAKPGTYAAKMVEENKSACWTLFSVSRAVQKWFFDHSLPVLVSGSCYEGIALPSVDYDYRAIGQHAAGMLSRLNCRYITLLMPEELRPGDAVTMEAFLQAARRSSAVKVQVLRASANHESYEKQLDDLLRPQSLPHGLFITDALKTLHTLTYLLQRRIDIGSSVSLISRDEDFYFDHLSVRPACYRLHKERFAAKFCRMLGQLAQSGSLPTKPALITPEFYKGDTV